MVSSDFRKEAREKLSGKWGKTFWITLIYIAIVLLLIYTTYIFKLGIIILIIVSVALSLAYTISLFKLFNTEDINVSDFFASGFHFFGKSWMITFRIIIKELIVATICFFSFTFCNFIVLSNIIELLDNITLTNVMYILYFTFFLYLIAIIIFIISSIILDMRLYYYKLSFIITAENPELSAKEAANKSKELMTGKRWKLFCLELSFIGWAILSVFSLGIGFLFLLPYMKFANIAFYKSITNAN